MHKDIKHLKNCIQYYNHLKILKTHSTILFFYNHLKLKCQQNLSNHKKLKTIL